MDGVMGMLLSLSLHESGQGKKCSNESLSGKVTPKTNWVQNSLYLNRVGFRVQEGNDLEGLLDDADGLQFLSVVAAVHHQGACLGGKNHSDGNLNNIDMT